MIFEYISTIIGIIKMLIYKLLYPKRVYFASIPKVNSSIHLATKKYCKIEIKRRFRCRNNVSLRVYNRGTLVIGNDCFLNDGCSINCQKNITIGNNLICGQNVMMFDHDHDYRNEINNFIREEIKIGDNVWIGANSIILKGVTIGDNVVIAAGTIVKENIPNNTLYYSEISKKQKKK